MVEHFLCTYSHQHRLAPKRISAEALQHLVHAPWPGNVRELAHVIERAVVLSRGDVIQPEDVALPALEGSPPPAGAAWSQTPLAAAEQAILRQVLREHGGDKRAAARTLGLSVSTLYAKLKKDQGLSPCGGGRSMTFDARDAGVRGVLPRASLGAPHADASRAG